LKLNTIKNRTVLIAPLDWGFGHSTRCVPLILQLHKNNEIILGVTNLNKQFFELHFPQLLKIELPSYAIRYSKSLNLVLKLLLQAPKILSIVKRENILLRKLISDYNIDLVISDGRFGCYSRQVHSVFITHQLNLHVPFFKGIFNAVNRHFMSRFNEIWVPDFPELEKRLSGELSHSTKINLPIRFIGPLSALEQYKTEMESYSCDVLVLLSGVEPQRSVLEEKLLKVIQRSDKKIILIRGYTENSLPTQNNLRIYNTCFGEELYKCISGAKKVICRSGYSSLMDLQVCKKNQITLIPTPGQTEQEYLADYWSVKFNSKVCLQKDVLDLDF